MSPAETVQNEEGSGVTPMIKTENKVIMKIKLWDIASQGPITRLYPFRLL